MDNLQTFICSCLGIPEDMCRLYDRIEDDFKTWEYYNLDESFVKEVIELTINEKGYKAGNLLIMDLFNQIINQYVEAYCDYPLTEDLFEMVIDGYYSELKFNGQKVENKTELDNAIEDWIINAQSK